MAKRNTKQAMYQPRQPQQVKRGGSAGKSPAKPGRAAGKTSAASPASGRPSSGARAYNRSVQPAPRGSAQASLLMVRIAAIVIVVAAVAGGTAWLVSMNGVFGAAEIAGLTALGFLAGLGLALALRTEQIVAKVAKLRREYKQRTGS